MGPWDSRLVFEEDTRLLIRSDRVLVDPEASQLQQANDNDPSLEALDEGDAPDPGAGGRRRWAVLATPDARATLAILRDAGVAARPSRALFADAAADGIDAYPVYANPGLASIAPTVETCDEHPGAGRSGQLDSPVVANPVYANPVYANGQAYQTTGVRRSTARPATEPAMAVAQEDAVRRPVVAILDTGLAHDRPPFLAGLGSDGEDEPDEHADGLLDPVAGHGTFCAGVVRQLAPAADIVSVRVLSTFGDGEEWAIAYAIEQLLRREPPVEVINLSLGCYSVDGMDELAAVIDLARSRDPEVVVIASAGNDATCRRTYPASLPGVWSVGALDGEGRPAPFSNFGPWVKLWAPGVDRVSAFFDWDGDERGSPDPDEFAWWATWSGTSFAAPFVAGRVAQHMARTGDDAAQAVEALAGAAWADVPPGGALIQ